MLTKEVIHDDILKPSGSAQKGQDARRPTELRLRRIVHTLRERRDPRPTAVGTPATPQIGLFQQTLK